MIRPRVVAIIQARMASTRLPGKVLFPLGGLPVLANVVSRVQRVIRVDAVVVATTVDPVDDELAAEADRVGAETFRGSETDVLARYHEAARAARADVVVRVTSDCPLLDSSVVDLVIDRYLSAPGSVDYVSNTIVRTYPRGLDVEVFSAGALADAAGAATALSEREHVTPYFHNNPERFRAGSVEYSRDLSSHRWTLDSPEDLRFLQHVFSGLAITKGSIPPFERVVEFLATRPEIVAINARVEQKAIDAPQQSQASQRAGR